MMTIAVEVEVEVVPVLVLVEVEVEVVPVLVLVDVLVLMVMLVCHRVPLGVWARKRERARGGGREFEWHASVGSIACSDLDAELLELLGCGDRALLDHRHT